MYDMYLLKSCTVSKLNYLNVGPCYFEWQCTLYGAVFEGKWKIVLFWCFLFIEVQEHGESSTCRFVKKSLFIFWKNFKILLFKWKFWLRRSTKGAFRCWYPWIFFSERKLKKVWHSRKLQEKDEMSNSSHYFEA